MALITSCQATFQNFSGYEDDLASLEENIRECYSEILPSSGSTSFWLVRTIT